MTTPTPLPDVEARLQELEDQLGATRRSLRCTKRWLAVAGIAGFGLLAAAAADLAAIDVLRTKRLEIVDHTGNVVLAASADDLGGRVDFWNNEGCNFLRLAGNEQGGDVAIWNCDGKSVAGLYANATGGELAILDNQGRRAARASSSSDGGVLQVLHGNTTLASLHGTGSGSVLGLHDKDGTIRINASSNGDSGALEIGGHLHLHANADSAALIMKRQDDHELLHLMSDPRENMAEVRLHSDNGEVVLSTGRDSRMPEAAVVNSMGEQVAHMTVRSEGGGAVVASAPDGTDVASIRSGAQGSGRVDLSDTSGNIMATMQTLPSRGATLALMSPNKKTACAMAASEDGGVLNLSNGQGTPVLVAGIASGRRDGAISVNNNRGIPVVTAGSTIGGTGQVVINDDNGHRIVALPQRFTTSAEPPQQK
ncbi:MAG: hypothetical protein CMJ29_09790 [Phycisphaerae bacterium]|nr:hypothetical protein [Phycisphaerae bacterium]